jgi:hypothetical protein
VHPQGNPNALILCRETLLGVLAPQRTGSTTGGTPRQSPGSGGTQRSSESPPRLRCALAQAACAKRIRRKPPLRQLLARGWLRKALRKGNALAPLYPLPLRVCAKRAVGIRQSPLSGKRQVLYLGSHPSARVSRLEGSGVRPQDRTGSPPAALDSPLAGNSPVPSGD